MTAQKLLVMFIFASFALPIDAQTNGPIEPNAGNWRTWVISSGRDYRVPPPPGAAETQAELRALADLDQPQRRASAAADRVLGRWRASLSLDRFDQRTDACRHTDDGISARACTPTWRSRCTTRRSRRGNRSTSTTGRGRASAITGCRRPCRFPTARRIRPSMPRRRRLRQACSPISCRRRRSRFRAWPNRRAGRACSPVFNTRATTTPDSRSAAKVAEQVIAKAKADGSDAVWTGTVPIGPCKWIGTNPGNVTAANWIPLLLDFAESIPTRATAGVRLAPGGGRDGDCSQLPRLPGTFVSQLQGVLLAKPRRSADLAIPVCRQMDL